MSNSPFAYPRNTDVEPIDALDERIEQVVNDVFENFNRRTRNELHLAVRALVRGTPEAPHRFAIILDGGLVQDVVSINPELIGMTYDVIDYDVEGAADDEVDTVKSPDGDDERAAVSTGHTIEKQLISYELQEIAPTEEELLSTARDMPARAALLEERHSLQWGDGDTRLKESERFARIKEIDRELMLGECDIAALRADRSLIYPENYRA